MRIAEGIQHALRESQTATTEKVAEELPQESVPVISTQLKLAAQKIRDNELDVEIQDLQEFMGAFT